jgi:hypothetical protein
MKWAMAFLQTLIIHNAGAMWLRAIGTPNSVTLLSSGNSGNVMPVK